MATINLGRVGYVHKGAYSPSAVYEKYDVVLYDHGSYLYIGTGGSGHAPTDKAYWQAMLDPAEMNAATEAAVQAAAEIRDRIVSIASPFSVTGNPVSCHPVKGLPLQVISHLIPAQEGEGMPSPSNIRALKEVNSCQVMLGEQEYVSQFTKSVYGGDYNWESGKNKATARYMELDGTETGWDLNANGDTSYFVRYFSSGIKGEENKAYMSHFRNYPELAYANAAGTYNVFRWQNHSSGVTRLCIRPDLTGYDVTDVNGSLAKWSAYLAAQKAAGTPVQIVYFVTDGEEEAIASGQEILALEGENMLSTDHGTLTVSGPLNPAWQNEQQDERIGALEDGAIEGGGNPGGDKENLLDELEERVNPLFGKKVSFLGDSICAGSNESTSYLGGYGKIIADRNGMIYENVAHGGATVTAETYSRSTGNPKPWLCRMIANMSEDADYAIIEGGLNDGWEESLAIGQMSSGYNATLDDSTYYGAFESMLKQLITRFKGKKIGYIAVPKIHSLYDSEQNAPNFYHIAMECCAKWGVPVCDLNTISPPVEYLKTFGDTYTADGTHPTHEGYLKYYCDPIEAWMKTLTTGGNSAATMAMKVVQSATRDMNAAIAALQTGKLSNEGVSFRRAKLNLADGTTIEIDVLTAVNGTVIIPYINQMPISIDTDKSVYNGKGWKGNTRLSGSSGSVKESTQYAAITGFIPVKKGNIGRFKFSAPSTCWDGTTVNDGWNIVAYYDSSFGFVGSICPLQSNGVVYGSCTLADKPTGSIKDGGIVSFTVPALDNIAYVRLSFSDPSSEGLGNLIVTVNEEIT